MSLHGRLLRAREFATGADVTIAWAKVTPALPVSVRGARDPDAVIGISALSFGRIGSPQADRGALVEASFLRERPLRGGGPVVGVAGAGVATTTTGPRADARGQDGAIMRPLLSAAVNITTTGGVDALNLIPALLNAGAQRVATNAAPVTVEPRMGVAA